MRYLLLFLAMFVVLMGIGATAAWAQAVASGVDPTSAVTILTAIGLGKYAAGIASVCLLVYPFVVHMVSGLPVASGTSPLWYQIVYGLLARLTGGYGAAAPTPINGIPARAIVPAPPVAVATAATTIPKGP